MDITRFLSDQDPDYQNILSELRRFNEPVLHQPIEALHLKSSASSGTGGKIHCQTPDQGCAAREQDQATVHGKASSNQPTGSVNTFSGNFHTGGGKMIQGSQFDSRGGPMSF